MPRISDEMGLAQISEDQSSSFSLEAEGFSVRTPRGQERIYLQHTTASGISGPSPVAKLQAVGQTEIRVSEVELQHGRLGEVLYSQGEGRFRGENALWVVTEDEEGGKLTIRTRDAK